MTPKTYYTVSSDALFKVRALCLPLADAPPPLHYHLLPRLSSCAFPPPSLPRVCLNTVERPQTPPSLLPAFWIDLTTLLTHTSLSSCCLLPSPPPNWIVLPAPLVTVSTHPALVSLLSLLWLFIIIFKRRVRRGMSPQHLRLCSATLSLPLLSLVGPRCLLINPSPPSPQHHHCPI